MGLVCAARVEPSAAKGVIHPSRRFEHKLAPHVGREHHDVVVHDAHRALGHVHGPVIPAFRGLADCVLVSACDVDTDAGALVEHASEVVRPVVERGPYLAADQAFSERQGRGGIALVHPHTCRQVLLVERDRVEHLGDEAARRHVVEVGGQDLVDRQALGLPDPAFLADLEGNIEDARQNLHVVGPDRQLGVAPGARPTEDVPKGLVQHLLGRVELLGHPIVGVVEDFADRRAP